MKKLITTILIILVALVIFLIVKSNKMENNITNPEETGGASGQFAKLSSNAIVVIDQRLTDFVIANSVNMENSGFVVIYRDAEGAPGAIIGVSKWFAAGQYAKEEIGLTESLMNGMNYYAELRADDGNGIFDPKDDKTVNGISGDPVRTTFNAKKDAPDPKTVEIYY